MSKAIIALAKDKIITSLVSPGAKEPIKKINEYGWQFDTLDLTFLEIAKHSPERRWRVLIGEDLSYVVRLTIPFTTKADEERQTVFTELTDKIPEELNDSQWDYKEVGVVEGETGEKRRDIIAFALVHDLLPAITKAAKKSGFFIEAIEPEIVARTRNANPLIGIALKEDLSGEDKSVLNIKPAAEINITAKSDNETASGESEEKRTNVKKSKTLILVIIFILMLGIAGYKFKDQLSTLFLSRNETVKVIPSVTPGLTLTPSVTTVPTPAATDISKLKIEVQNGSGVRGEANSVKDILLDKGFSNIDTGNADNSSYINTEVVLPAGADSAVFDKLKIALEDYYNVVLSKNDLPASSGYDALVIIGKKK